MEITRTCIGRKYGQPEFGNVAQFSRVEIKLLQELNIKNLIKKKQKQIEAIDNDIENEGQVTYLVQIEDLLTDINWLKALEKLDFK